MRRGSAVRHMSRSHDLDGVAAGFGAVFGADHVHFLPYELLRDDPDAFTARLGELIGVAIEPFMPKDRLNASPPAPFLLLARSVNALIDAQAPEILETNEWRNFMQFAMFSAGNAKGLDRYSRTICAGERSRRARCRVWKTDATVGKLAGRGLRKSWRPCPISEIISGAMAYGRSLNATRETAPKSSDAVCEGLRTARWLTPAKAP